VPFSQQLLIQHPLDLSISQLPQLLFPNLVHSIPSKEDKNSTARHRTEQNKTKQKNKKKIEFEFNISSFLSIFFFGMALILAPAGFGPDIVKERQEGIKHQLVVMGVPLKIYWLSAFIRDWLFFSITTAICLILIRAISVSTLLSFLLFVSQQTC